MKRLAKISLIILIIFSFSLNLQAGDKFIRTFAWQLATYNFEIDIEFSQSLNEIYKQLPRAKLGADSALYYSQFLTVLSQDEIIDKMAKDFSYIAGQVNMPVAYIVTSFTQSLPYDHQAKQINFYYNNLFNGSATCWGKAIITYLVLKKLGYGVSLIYFGNIPLPQGGTDQHVVSAIADDSPYAIFNGYSYIETHSVVPIGYLPVTRGKGYLTTDELDINPEHNKSNLKKLGPYHIWFPTVGSKLSDWNYSSF